MNLPREFEELAGEFEAHFQKRHFPDRPENLYNAAQYLLTMKGKLIRPVLCLMGNELFNPISEDAYNAGMALELFHNFTLVHDDIMDKSPVRRGKPTVHEKFGVPTAILAGDVMLVKSYEYLLKVDRKYQPSIFKLFNETAAEVCEGQELDMRFERKRDISMDKYLEMIALKTSVLLATSLKMGAMIGGAGIANQVDLYEFGKSLGIAFQIQDDYLDVFGDPGVVGKKRAGDIMANKVTFLFVKTMEVATGDQKEELLELMNIPDESKIEPIARLYETCGVKEWAGEMKSVYFKKATDYLEDVAVVNKRKEPLRNLANTLMSRKK